MGENYSIEVNSLTSGVWLSLLLTVEISLPSKRCLPINLTLMLVGECFPDVIRRLFGRGEDQQDIWTCVTEETLQMMMLEH